jgi:hypothetical protein
MNSSRSSQQNPFIITTLSTRLKLITFLGFSLVLFGIFSPVFRQANGVTEVSDTISVVLSGQPDSDSK